MKRQVTIYLNEATPVTFNDTKQQPQPGQRYFKGITKRAKLVKRERGTPGIYNPAYSQSGN